MPRRRAKGLNPIDVPPTPTDRLTISRAAFQVLHNAARSVYRNAIQIDNHSVESMNYLTLLDAAIDEGHQALGTERSSADQYIHMVSGLTQLQMQNARRILEGEGLLDPTLQKDDS